LCKRLTVYYHDYAASYQEELGNPLYYIANDFTTWFTGVRSLTLFELRDNERVWQLLRQGLCKFRSLTELSLRQTYRYDIDLWRVVDMINELAYPQLRTLALYGVTIRDSSAREKTQVSDPKVICLKTVDYMKTINKPFEYTLPHELTIAIEKTSYVSDSITEASMLHGYS
jgi:hypothetical protein